MISTSNLAKPSGEQPELAEHGFDLHRAYRAMIREILRRQLLKRTVYPSAEEESHA
jgi:hypothetical protein